MDRRRFLATLPLLAVPLVFKLKTMDLAICKGADRNHECRYLASDDQTGDFGCLKLKPERSAIDEEVALFIKDFGNSPLSDMPFGDNCDGVPWNLI